MKPQSAKNKGRSLQKLVRDLILGLNPELEEDDVLSRSMGSNGEDVILSPAARKLVPIKTECKNKEQTLQLYRMYEQAKEHPGPYEPVLIVKKNWEEPLAVVDAVYFLKLLRRIVELERR